MRRRGGRDAGGGEVQLPRDDPQVLGRGLHGLGRRDVARPRPLLQDDRLGLRCRGRVGSSQVGEEVGIVRAGIVRQGRGGGERLGVVGV